MKHIIDVKTNLPVLVLQEGQFVKFEDHEDVSFDIKDKVFKVVSPNTDIRHLNYIESSGVLPCIKTGNSVKLLSIGKEVRASDLVCSVYNIGLVSSHQVGIYPMSNSERETLTLSSWTSCGLCMQRGSYPTDVPDDLVYLVPCEVESEEDGWLVEVRIVDRGCLRHEYVLSTIYSSRESAVAVAAAIEEHDKHTATSVLPYKKEVYSVPEYFCSE